METEMTETMYVDRSGWPAGEWDDEPDRIEWRSEGGLPCLMLRNRMGAWCGYVAVQPGHPWHGSGALGLADVDVHGGVTYGDKCGGRICHVPQPGESADVWWVGFDCLHYMDTAPGLIASDLVLGLGHARGDYWTAKEVRTETEYLARQAREACK